MGGNAIKHLGRSSASDGAARIDDIADHVTLPRPPGVANTGVSPIASPSDHVHPKDDPAVIGSTLYPAAIPDTNLRASCKGLVNNAAFWGSTPTQIAGVSTWRASYASPLQFDGVSSPNFAKDGDRIFTTGETVHDGIYEVVDCGIHNNDGSPWNGLPGYNASKPVIRRAIDANTPAGLHQNMAVQIVCPFSGATHNNDYFTQTAVVTTVDADDPTFTVSSSYTPATLYDLLTSPQLASMGADRGSYVMTVTATAGDVSFPQYFETTVGTPALGALPAGLWTSDNEGFWIDPSTPPSAGSVTTLRWQIWNANTATLLFTMESPPISTTVEAALSFQFADAGHTIAPTDSLEAVAVLHTTSTTPVIAHLRYNGPRWLTRITVPFQMAVTGASTGRHQDLSGRDLLDQHPQSAITPAVDVTTSSAWLWPAMDTATGKWRSSCIRWTSVGDLLGISSTWTDGTPIPDCFEMLVEIVNALPGASVIVRDGATPPGGSTFLPLALPAVAGATEDLEFDSPASLWFVLNSPELRWRLKTYQAYTVPAIGGGGSSSSFTGAIDGGTTGDSTSTIDGGHS
jgi:hypothetical protein